MDGDMYGRSPAEDDLEQLKRDNAAIAKWLNEVGEAILPLANDVLQAPSEKWFSLHLDPGP